MTEKLYQDNPYLFEFASRVISVHEGESRYEVILEATAFYPESGGQLYDIGTIEGIPILNVIEKDDGEIIHILERGNLSPGMTVNGQIDRTRRLDNMRKHTGQHILSRAFIEVAAADTVSSRLGEVESTIELSLESLDDAVLISVEKLANNIIRQNQPVKIEYYEREALKNLPVRKIPEREGKFRIVQVGEFDYTACGGTHCRNAGEVGMVKIIGQEKLRGHLRVIFLVGRQAEEDYCEKHTVVNQLSGRLTCHFRDLVKGVDKLTEQNTALRREVSLLSGRLLAVDLKEIAENSPDLGGIKIVTGEFDGRDPKALKDAANKLGETVRAIIFLLCGDKLLIFAPAGIKLTASAMSRLFMERFGGKGGGSATSAQVGGIAMDKRKEYIDHFIGLIRGEIAP
jgi:alanyl-tRNA synthetase